MAAGFDTMIHPDTAREIILAKTRSLPTEVVHLLEAGDRVLAEPLIADVDLPPFRASTMDGYAVIHNDTTIEREVVGTGFAGQDLHLKLAPGKAARIMTGAPVPDGATAVVMVENTSATGNTVRILQESVAEGENIRPIGSDMKSGDLLVPAGTRLGPAEVGLLASLGHEQVTVGGRPRVAIMSTGDELVAPGETPGPGQIRDSNRFTLAVAARQAGAEVVMNRHVPDSQEHLQSAFSEALSLADVVITSGGVSMGDRDLVKALLGELAEVHFQKVFFKPGKPLNFATIGDKVLFGLPGNPVSSLVCFHIFVMPAMRKLQSAPPDGAGTITVTTTMPLPPSDRIEYQRAVVWVGEDGNLVARNTGSQISARLASFLGANAFLIVPPAEDVHPAGSGVKAILLAPPYSQEPR